MDRRYGRKLDRALELWVVLSRAYAAVQRVASRDIERHGLTPAGFAVLDALHHKGPLLLGELQRKVLVSSGGITYLVDQLAAKGLVERRACATDRRASYAALTLAGEALMERIFGEHAEAIGRAMAGLSAREQDQATQLLRGLGLYAASLADAEEAATTAVARKGAVRDADRVSSEDPRRRSSTT